MSKYDRMSEADISRVHNEQLSAHMKKKYGAKPYGGDGRSGYAEGFFKTRSKRYRYQGLQVHTGSGAAGGGYVEGRNKMSRRDAKNFTRGQQISGAGWSGMVVGGVGGYLASLSATNTGQKVAKGLGGVAVVGIGVGIAGEVKKSRAAKATPWRVTEHYNTPAESYMLQNFYRPRVIAEEAIREAELERDRKAKRDMHRKASTANAAGPRVGYATNSFFESAHHHTASPYYYRRQHGKQVRVKKGKR